MVERPTEKVFQMLIDFKVASIKDRKYVYSPEFRESVKQLKANPPGRLKQLKLGREATKIIDSVILYARSLRKKRHIENMISAYVILKGHFKRLNLEMPKTDLPELIYGTWYLNENESEVQDAYI